MYTQTGQSAPFLSCRRAMNSKMLESRRVQKRWKSTQRWWYQYGHQFSPVFWVAGIGITAACLFFTWPPPFGASRTPLFLTMLAVTPNTFSQDEKAEPQVARQPMAVEGLRDGQKSSHMQSDTPTPLVRKPKTACLAMIIKNEGPILPRLFESVQGFVSEYCIVDTGSTDDTIDVLRSMDMPGVILEEPFVNFATTRNYMIDQCRKS